MRLIDADALLNDYELDDVAERNYIEYLINKQSIVDAEPVRHGRIVQTIKDGKYHREFSCCGSKCTQLTMWVKPLYCIYCGAKMDGE